VDPTLGSLLRTDHKKTIVRTMPDSSVPTFRSLLREMVVKLPATPSNTPEAVNQLLHEVEGGCVRFQGWMWIDVDWLVMKLLTFWCRARGGANWFNAPDIYQPPKSRAGSRGRGAKGRGGRGRRGSFGKEEEKKAADVMVVEKPQVVVTKMQMDKFLGTPACDMMVEWIRAFRERLRHRAEMDKEGAVEEAEEAEEVEKPEFEDIFAGETNPEFDEFKPKVSKLPTIKYKTTGLKLGCVNLKDDKGEEVSFEEYRMSSDSRNRTVCLSIILRTHMNHQFTVRAAPFDLVGDLIQRSRVQQQNPGKTYVLSFDGVGLDESEKIIK
jgi:hypothetical protein